MKHFYGSVTDSELKVKSKSGYFNVLFVIVYFIGLFGGFSFLQDSEGNGPKLSVFIYPVLYVLTLIVFFRNWRFAWQIYFWPIMIFLFTGISVSSIVCYFPMRSIIALICLAMNFLFAWWIVATFNKDQFLQIIFKVINIMTAGAIILAIININYIIFHDPIGRSNIIGLVNIKGLFPHKIQAGLYASVGVLLALYLQSTTHQRRYYLYALFYAAFVIASGSSLAFASLLATLALTSIVLFTLRHLGYPGLLYGLSIVLFVATVVITYELSPVLLSMLDRDEGLTGRLDIWMFGVDYILRNPLLGGGFGVFFEPYYGAPAQELWQMMRWYRAPSFHNGYIQLLAETGFIGSIPFLIILGIVLLQEISKQNFAIISVLLLFLVANFGASLFVEPNSFFITFLMCVFVYSIREKNERS